MSFVVFCSGWREILSGWSPFQIYLLRRLILVCDELDGWIRRVINFIAHALTLPAAALTENG